MEKSQLEKEMKSLWKQTFHDSDEYVDLVFSGYFDPERVEYEEKGGKLTAALLGVPYDFKGAGRTLKGMYLCGLATAESERRKGIMTSLLEKANQKAREEGYNFTFLIPASDGLGRYYRDRGYVDAIYRVENHYTNVHDFSREYISLLSNKDERIYNLKKKYFESLNCKILEKGVDNWEKIVDFLTGMEASTDKDNLQLMHSGKDFDRVISDNFLSKGEIYVCSTSKGEIRAVAFIIIENRSEIKVLRVYHTDACSFYKTLDAIKRQHYDHGMTVYQSPDVDNEVALWQLNYAAPETGGSRSGGVLGVSEMEYKPRLHMRTYGMARILQIDEILKFIAPRVSGRENSILVKNGENNEISQYRFINYGVEKTSYTLEEFGRRFGESKIGSAMSLRGLSAILCRKPDSDNWIMEAFGLPRLGIEISLMLD